jgi:hypothetical protein
MLTVPDGFLGASAAPAPKLKIDNPKMRNERILRMLVI